jgi:predicted MFS family arabinose efflux permease
MDRRRIELAAFIRAVATSFVGVELGLMMAAVGQPPAAVGVIVGSGLGGAAVAALVATLYADRIGRRRLLIGLALLTALGSLIVAFSTPTLAIAAGVFVGMLNGMGRDRGAALTLEQAMLADLAGEDQRTKAIARYNVYQDVGHAIGAGLAALPKLVTALPVATAHRASMLLPLIAGLVLALIASRLSPDVEAKAHAAQLRITPESKSVLVKISLLFGLDSLGGGFLTASLLAYFFFERFHASEPEIAALFVGARILNAFSHLGAAWLAKRIGLVNTMVFTHLPAGILLLTVPWAPTFGIAAALFLIREGLVEMDVPTRQSYVLAVVKPEERAFASGVTNLVRMIGWALGPLIAGPAMGALTLGAPLIAGASMKISYDLLLYRAFRHLRPPEERR